MESLTKEISRDLILRPGDSQSNPWARPNSSTHKRRNFPDQHKQNPTQGYIPLTISVR
ncbi:hypothetical protein BJ997_001116 [Cryobacterium roopkundense]|uniref:Uncharacterized protein n=1 Tax=Cryobacterium roopkundense TaxID=1001240 RepID=A0A7W9E2W7_9MICO|nr:hypothetical protein [Cryobacterium roopkundense]